MPSVVRFARRTGSPAPRRVRPPRPFDGDGLQLIRRLARVHDHPVAFHRKPEALLLGDALHELKVALLPLLHPLVDQLRPR
ncbi:MAG: hypothetical protein ACLR0N_10025 [Bilophila wadsworthia]